MPVNFEILRAIEKLRTGISQKDNEEMFRLYAQEANSRMLRFKSGLEHNGWIVPCHWEVLKAEIKFKNKIIFDGNINALAVAGSSGSFQGTINKSELDRHVFFSKTCPDAYLYNPFNNLRPWQKGWAFCVPYNIYKEWEDGQYSIDLRTKFEPHFMEVLEYFHEGLSKETIVFNAHTCHPQQINDGHSGASVIAQIFKSLKGKKTRYSYKGILTAEHLGTVFYLHSKSCSEIKEMKLGIFLESIGSCSPLRLQKSFNGSSIIDTVAEYALSQKDSNLDVGLFRSQVGNDETVWEAPGIEIPMVSINRHPFDEYHTSFDNVDNQSVEMLDAILEACLEIIDIFETDHTIMRKFNGLIALSNPKYDLYRSRGNSSFEKMLTKDEQRWGPLQDHIMRYFDGNCSAFQIASTLGVNFKELSKYLDNFKNKGLVELKPISSIDLYDSYTKPNPLQ